MQRTLLLVCSCRFCIGNSVGQTKSSSDDEHAQYIAGRHSNVQVFQQLAMGSSLGRSTHCLFWTWCRSRASTIWTCGWSGHGMCLWWPIDSLSPTWKATCQRQRTTKILQISAKALWLKMSDCGILNSKQGHTPKLLIYQHFADKLLRRIFWVDPPAHRRKWPLSIDQKNRSVCGKDPCIFFVGTFTPAARFVGEIFYCGTFIGHVRMPHFILLLPTSNI